MNEHLLQVYEIECGSKGNAFLTDEELLITVRHVVGASRIKDLSLPCKIMLNPRNGGEKIECQILEHDEDEFDNSTLVLLKPQWKLPHHALRVAKTVLETPKLEIAGYLSGGFEELTIAEAKPIVLQNIVGTGEKVNTGIVINSSHETYGTFSGSPVVCGNEILGVLIAEAVISGLAYKVYALCDQEFRQRVEKLRKRLQEKLEAQQKASQPAPTFAEYVADACDDCPNGLRVLYDLDEYKRKHPNYAEKNSDEEIVAQQSKLKDFLFQMGKAGRAGVEDFARIIKNNALEVLAGLYSGDSNIKKRQNVYISAMFDVFSSEYLSSETRCKNLESVKHLLDVAAEDFEDAKYFHAYRHLLLAHYYIALARPTEAEVELREVENRCQQNPNCYAYMCNLDERRLSLGDGETDCARATRYLNEAVDHRPEESHFSLTYTGAWRQLAYYQAKTADTNDDDWNLGQFKKALESVENAYQGDCKEGGSENGRKQDGDYFKYICRKALDHYVQKGFDGYRDWRKFYTEAATKRLYTIWGNDLEEETMRRWIGLLAPRNCNGRNSVQETLKSTDVLEYAYSCAKIPETFATLLQENVHKALFVQVTDCRAVPAEEFESLSNQFDQKFRSIQEMKGNDFYYALDEGVRLYMYEYQHEEGKSLPVWHLVCMK